ncbi:MAG: AAA family ATPase, partial [Chloroflexi bacterium]|nr:AAA family ATPase [Chloroflexota bacterium]
MVPQGGVTLLAGETASGKSLLGLDLALGMAAGRGRAWDMEIGGEMKQGAYAVSKGAEGVEGAKVGYEARVRYFCGDADPNLIAERVLRLCRGYPNGKKGMGIDVPDALGLD